MAPRSTQAGDGSQDQTAARSGAVTFIFFCSSARPRGPQAVSLASQMPHSRGKPLTLLDVNAGNFKSLQL